MDLEAKIIDGKALALEYEERLIKKLENTEKVIKVVSFSDEEDSDADKYSELKSKKAFELRIDFQIIEIDQQTKLDDLKKGISKACKDPEITGVMIQLPFPKHLQDHYLELVSLITPQKDIDGLTGKSFLPAAVRGTLSILDSLNLDPNLTYAVVGSEGVIGKPLVQELSARGLKVIMVDKKLPQTSVKDIKDADVILSCTGVEGLIKPEYIKDGVILIDIGLGDFDSGCYLKSVKYTPKIGGVGPMTVISLMENIVKACYNF